uniref:Biogenesis of lysosome-related organelles complex 1 subunit 7 n=1 Tax=Fundulus heteroclitus TaxID=8078 RepID=A0A3Q2QZS3_FUNHE
MAAVAVVEASPGADPVAEGLLELIKPAIQQLDLHVHSVRESQVELREHIDNLATGGKTLERCLHGSNPCLLHCSPHFGR